MSKKISTLSPGNLVMLNENGVAKKFIFLEFNHYGRNEVVLLRKDASGHQAYNGGSTGYNPYNGSQLDAFCNGSYLDRLDSAIRAALVSVPIPTIRGHVNGTYSSALDNLERKGFSLSSTEVGFSGTDGQKFDYFAGNANRIAYFDNTSSAVNWWLRSPYSSDGGIAYVVSNDGAQHNRNVYSANICPRPALALSSEILVSDSASTDGAYTIEDAAIAGELYQKINNVWRRVV